MIKIVTDSSALVSKAEAKKYRITIVPISITIGNETYQDSINMNGRKLIAFMDQHRTPFPSTSQPSIGEFVDTYNRLTADGSQVLSIHMTHLLSGTVNAARSAARLANGRIKVVNSHYIDQSLRHMVIVAAQMAMNHADLDQILARLQTIRQKSLLCIGASTLDNLVKGGRISKATGLLSRLLNLHVVFILEDKDMKLQKKGRGKKTFYRWFRDFVNQIRHWKLSYIGISYTGSLEFPKYAENYLHKLFPQIHIILRYTSATVANHTGKDAFAIMLCRK